MMLNALKFITFIYILLVMFFLLKKNKKRRFIDGDKFGGNHGYLIVDFRRLFWFDSNINFQYFYYFIIFLALQMQFFSYFLIKLFFIQISCVVCVCVYICDVSLNKKKCYKDVFRLISILLYALRFLYL